MGYWQWYVVVAMVIGIVAGLGLGSLLAAGKIGDLKEELAHMRDIVKAAGLMEEDAEHGR